MSRDTEHECTGPPEEPDFLSLSSYHEFYTYQEYVQYCRLYRQRRLPPEVLDRCDTVISRLNVLTGKERCVLKLPAPWEMKWALSQALPKEPWYKRWFRRDEREKRKPTALEILTFVFGLCSIVGTVAAPSANYVPIGMICGVLGLVSANFAQDSNLVSSGAALSLIGEFCAPVAVFFKVMAGTGLF